MTNNNHIEGNGILQVLDVRIKIVFTLFFSVAVATSKNLVAVYIGLLFLMIILFSSHISFKEVGKRLAVVEGLLLMVVLLLPFSVQGKVCFCIWGICATTEGVRYAILIFLRSSTVILCNILFLCTSDIFTVAHGLHHLGLPSKLAKILFFTARYVDVVSREYHRMRKAMKARAFKPSTNVHTYRSYAYLIGMLLIRSHERAERIYKAMLCRGFSDTIPVYKHFQLQKVDNIFVTLGLPYLVILCIIAWK